MQVMQPIRKEDNTMLTENTHNIIESAAFPADSLDSHTDKAKETDNEWASHEELFRQMVSEWKKEASILSSPRAITSHRAYQRIIDMGEPALPLIFNDMKSSGGWWYPALRAITGGKPCTRRRQRIPTKERRSMAAMGAG